MRALTVIKSCQRYIARRQAVRETWLPLLDWTEHLFVIGGPGNVREDDVLHLPNHADDFPNIAPKVAMACRWAVGRGYDYVFVCDDDTYVRPLRLESAVPVGSDYVGYLRDGAGFGTPYIQGSAYWLSRRAAEIVAYSTYMVNGVIDDGAVGQALLGQVHFVHDDRYEPGPIWNQRYPRRDNDLVTTHKCLPGDMRAVHQLWDTT